MRILSAADNIWKTASQDVRSLLSRSDYPDLYNPQHLQSSFSDGWHHYPDEPDLLHKTTSRGMTFSIYPSPRSKDPYYMVLHSPEGASRVNYLSSLPKAMKVQKEIESDPSKMQQHLGFDPWQSQNIKLMNEAIANGGEARDQNGYIHTINGIKDNLERMKASEEAIAMGGDSLVGNLDEAYRRRGL